MNVHCCFGKGPCGTSLRVRVRVAESASGSSAMLVAESFEHEIDFMETTIHVLPLLVWMHGRELPQTRSLSWTSRGMSVAHKLQAQPHRSSARKLENLPVVGRVRKHLSRRRSRSHSSSVEAESM